MENKTCCECISFTKEEIKILKEIIEKQKEVKLQDSKNQKVNEHSDLTLFLKKAFPNMTKEEGKIIWDILENKDLIVDGKQIAGTFRYNASCIASVAGNGTDYMDFYCSWVHSQREQEFIKKIEEVGGKITNLNFHNK